MLQSDTSIKRKLAAAYHKLDKLERNRCFDPLELSSRPTSKQQEIMDDIGVVQHRYVVAGNQSGKSQTGSREVSWVWTETHPTWKRPAAWKDESLVLLVVGRTTKQVEEVLWRKISAFVPANEVELTRVGGSLQKAVHKPTGNTIIFASHHSEREAREKLQAYVAHYVWIDEMPGSYKILEELHRRVQARKGMFLATLTPKVINRSIKRLVDAADGVISKKYKMAMLDNPVYEGRHDEILSTMSTYGEAFRNTLLYGDWSVGEESVYSFDYDSMVRTPPGYTLNWKHVESVVPGLRGLAGTLVWAEDPRTYNWYCIHASYEASSIDAIQKALQLYTPVRRVCSPDHTWFHSEAAEAKLRPAYTFPAMQQKGKSASARKGELIKAVQKGLGTKLFLSPECSLLVEEFMDCAWTEGNADKIINEDTFTMIKAVQNFADLIPTPELTLRSDNWEDHLYQQNNLRKKNESRQNKMAGKQRPRLSKPRKYRIN